MSKPNPASSGADVRFDCVRDAAGVVSMAALTRLAPVEAINVASRTVDLIFTAGATVRRRSWEGPYDEVMPVTDSAVDLSRLNASAPLLDSHFRYSVEATLGVVEPGSARIEGGKGLATVRFPKAGISDLADRTFGMVEDKIIRNVSVGYSALQVRIVKADRAGGVDQWILERWLPFEVSLVTVPADAGAQVRAAFAPIEIAGLGAPQLVAGGLGAAMARMRMRAAAGLFLGR